MKILVCHNFYQQPGGEDRVFHDEVDVLRQHGHEVLTYTRHNDDLRKMPGFEAALDLTWSARTYREVQALIRQHRPDMVHVHNFFPLLSPSVFYAAKAEHVPVVWTLHNSRLMCPSARLMRQGQPCTECLGKSFAFPAVRHCCYRGSRVYSLAVALMTFFHSCAGTWGKVVNAYIVMTDFYKDLVLQHGVPSSKVYMKPNMVAEDPGIGEGNGAYALFVGRFDPEKGVMTLLKAWKVLQERGVVCPLRLRGEGRLMPEMQAFIAAHGIKDVTFVDRPSSRAELFALMKGARFLVWPSEGFFETFGLVAFESFACGRPVIASDIGVLAEHVIDQRTGLRFIPADPVDLAKKVRWAWEHPQEMRQMGLAGRKVYEEKCMAWVVYECLIRIYQDLVTPAPRAEELCS